VQTGGRAVAYGQARVALGGIGHGFVGGVRLRWWHVPAARDTVEQRAGDGRLGALVLVSTAATAGGRRVSGGLDGSV
jgi:hypothetical protein